MDHKININLIRSYLLPTINRINYDYLWDLKLYTSNIYFNLEHFNSLIFVKNFKIKRNGKYWIYYL